MKMRFGNGNYARQIKTNSRWDTVGGDLQGIEINARSSDRNASCIQISPAQTSRERNQMEYDLLPASFSSLAVRFLRGISMPMRKIYSFSGKTIAASLVCTFICGVSYADSGYNIVQMSTAAPVGTQQSFLALTTNNFQATVLANPLAANTNTIKIFGPNPNAPGIPTTLDQALALGATVYVYGFANGMSYQQKAEIGCVSMIDNLCSSATNFSLSQTSTATFNMPTCRDVAGTILLQLYQMSLSTPTIIPPTGP
jgi:hypothetical protein